MTNRIKEALAELSDADGAISSKQERFLQILSHELRNPLMALLTAAEAVTTRATNDAESGDPLVIIRRQSAILAELLDYLLDDSQTAGRGSEGEGPSAEDLVPGKLLLVEDQDDNREMLAMVLNRAGHDVVETDDVATATEALSMGGFGAAIIDIGLPDGSGHDVAKFAREKHGDDILLIALTGQGRESDRQAVLDSGFNIHLVKPVSTKDVRQALGETAIDTADTVTEASSESPIRVVPVGPEIVVAAGIECLVASQDEFNVVASAETREVCLTTISEIELEVVLVYASVANGLGADLIHEIGRRNRDLGIAVVVEEGENTLARESMLAGADTCIATSSDPEDLLRAIRLARSGGVFVANEVDASVVRDEVFTALTRREREVLRLVANGMTSRRVAAELNIAYKTVDAHRQNIVKKLEAPSTCDLVKHAIRAGLTDLQVNRSQR